MYHILRSTFPVYASFGQEKHVISGMIFALEKTSFCKSCTNKLELFWGTLSWSTITWNSFGWPLTRVSQLSLSIHSGVHKRDQICGLAFQRGRRCVARVWVPCHSNMHRARVSCASVRYMQYIKRKWLGHIAPPSKSQFRGQGIHTAILQRDLRDASLENTSGPSFELRNSNYASRCKFPYTRSKIPSFEWSFKLRNSND